MKTKSKLVLGLSILSAATLAAGVTSTFAWYTAQAGINSSGTENILTDKNVQMANDTLVAHFAGTGTSSAIKRVDLTDASGVAKVWTGSVAAPATNQGVLVKSEKITLTFSTDHAATTGGYAGTYPVTVTASGQLRLATSYNDSQTSGNAGYGAWDSNDYVGYYYHTGMAIDPAQENTGTNTATGNQVINLGFVVVDSSGNITYKNIGDGGVVGSAVDNLFFYVSVSPQNEGGEETVDEAGQNYGTITPAIGTYGTDFSA